MAARSRRMFMTRHHSLHPLLESDRTAWIGATDPGQPASPPAPARPPAPSPPGPPPAPVWNPDHPAGGEEPATPRPEVPLGPGVREIPEEAPPPPPPPAHSRISAPRGER